MKTEEQVGSYDSIVAAHARVISEGWICGIGYDAAADLYILRVWGHAK